MKKHSPLTTRFQRMQNRIDDGMFAMNIFAPSGVGTFKKMSKLRPFLIA